MLVYVCISVLFRLVTMRKSESVPIFSCGYYCCFIKIKSLCVTTTIVIALLVVFCYCVLCLVLKAIAQSGFKVDGATALDRFFKTAFKPPFRGTVATIGGMAWARAAIFYGSDFGKEVLNKRFHSSKGSENSSVIAFITSALPPLVCSTLVQVVNMPLIRSTITIQNPSSELHSVRAAMMVSYVMSCFSVSFLYLVQHIYHKKGVSGLWHGLSAGLFM